MLKVINVESHKKIVSIHSMIRKILIHSYLQLINNNKLTKVVLFSLFAHSLIAVFVIVFNAYIMIENEFKLNSSNEVIRYIVTLFKFEHIGRVTAWLVIFLFFWYFVFSPIGEYIIIHHLDTGEKISKSFSKAFNKFHLIAKYDGMTFIFSIMLFVRISLEAMLYKANNGIVVLLLTIWFLMVAFVTVLLEYSKTIIAVEWLTPFEAMKKSITLSMDHLGITLKLVGISLIFNFRMIFNILFIIWVPFVAILLLKFFGIVGGIGDIVVYLLFFGVFLFLAYINTLIEWYFRIFWYISYEYILWNTEQLEKLWILKPKAGIGGLFHDESLAQQDIDEMKLLETHY